MYRSMALLLGANAEAVILIIAAWFGAKILDDKFPLSFTWQMITFPLALAIMFHTWFFIFKRLRDDMNRGESLNKKT